MLIPLVFGNLDDFCKLWNILPEIWKETDQSSHLFLCFRNFHVVHSSNFFRIWLPLTWILWRGLQITLILCESACLHVQCKSRSFHSLKKLFKFIHMPFKFVWIDSNVIYKWSREFADRLQYLSTPVKRQATVRDLELLSASSWFVNNFFCRWGNSENTFRRIQQTTRLFCLLRHKDLNLERPACFSYKVKLQSSRLTVLDTERVTNPPIWYRQLLSNFPWVMASTQSSTRTTSDKSWLSSLSLFTFFFLWWWCNHRHFQMECSLHLQN